MSHPSRCMLTLLGIVGMMSIATADASSAEIIIDTLDGDYAVHAFEPINTHHYLVHYHPSIGGAIPAFTGYRIMEATAFADSGFQASSELVFGQGAFRASQHFTAGPGDPEDHYAYAALTMNYSCDSLDLRPYSALVIHGSGTLDASELVYQLYLRDMDQRYRFAEIVRSGTSIGDIVFDLGTAPYHEDPGFRMDAIQILMIEVAIRCADPPLPNEEGTMTYVADSVALQNAQPVAVRRTTWGDLKSRFR
jgi:hypothetical protein